MALWSRLAIFVDLLKDLSFKNPDESKFTSSKFNSHKFMIFLLLVFLICLSSFLVNRVFSLAVEVRELENKLEECSKPAEKNKPSKTGTNNVRKP